MPTAEAILDEGVLCHVGLSADHGPVVIPTTYARRGDELLIHGSPAASWLRAAGKRTAVCVTVTHVDGLVLARSAFHHSMNFRSVVVFGVAERITDPVAKAVALDAIVEHIVPGRTAEVRPMWESEITETLVLRLALAEASVKVRSGGPIDDDEDYSLPDVWAGVVPMTTTFGPRSATSDCPLASKRHRAPRRTSAPDPAATGLRRATSVPIPATQTRC